MSAGTARREPLVSENNPGRTVSPLTHRRLSKPFTASPLANPMLSNIVNNDDDEIRRRRKNRMSDAAFKSIQTPETQRNQSKTGGSTSSYVGWNSNQVTEHLNNCIQLFQENKINTKNAFSLHLIDTMRDMLSKEEQTNFQMAGSTLEAGAKIYASRVDALHLQAIQVNDQVSQIDKGKESSSRGGDGMGDEDNEAPDGPVRKVRKKKKIIETDLKKINMANFDTIFEIDPLLQKISKEGDSSFGGILLGSLRCRDDFCSLLLDMKSSTHPSEQWTSNEHKLLDSEALQNIPDISHHVICPTFNNFQHDSSQQHPIWDLIQEREEHRFDPDKEISFNEDHPVDDDFPGDDMDSESPAPNRVEETQIDYVGCSKSGLQTVVSNQTDATLHSLLSMVGKGAGEYSFFGNIKNMWAGPSHWKAALRIPSSNKRCLEDGDGTTRKKVAGKTKERITINFSEEIDFDKYFKKTRAATTVKKTTLDKYDQVSQTLPEDIHYESSTLLKLFTRSSLMKTVRQSAVSDNSESADIDDDKFDDDYDYGNKTDRDNFCPDMTAVSGGYDYVGTQPSMLNMEDTLLAQPRLIEKISINFAKRPKKVDFKRLKRNMWNLITTERDQNKENEEVEPVSPVVKDHTSFNDMYSDLRPLCPQQESKDLSKAIAFVALLHMCNEKNLALEATEKFDDLYISAGEK